MSDIPHIGDYDEKFCEEKFPLFEKELFEPQVIADIKAMEVDIEGKSALDICNDLFINGSANYSPDEMPAFKAFHDKWKLFLPFLLYWKNKQNVAFTIEMKNHVGDLVCIVTVPMQAIFSEPYYVAIHKQLTFYPYLVTPSIRKGIIDGDMDLINKVNRYVSSSSIGSSEALLRTIKVADRKYYDALISKCELVPVED